MAACYLEEIFLLRRNTIYTFCFVCLFLLAGKTERGSYSSYGRESNLQGCHQVSENLDSGEGLGELTW